MLGCRSFHAVPRLSVGSCGLENRNSVSTTALMKRRYTTFGLPETTGMYAFGCHWSNCSVGVIRQAHLRPCHLVIPGYYSSYRIRPHFYYDGLELMYPRPVAMDLVS